MLTSILHYDTNNGREKGRESKGEGGKERGKERGRKRKREGWRVGKTSIIRCTTILQEITIMIRLLLVIVFTITVVPGVYYTIMTINYGVCMV